jgi:hypothetical protein
MLVLKYLTAMLALMASIFAFAGEAETYQKQLKMCYNRITSEWPTKRIYLMKEREGRVQREMAIRCYQPACEQPFTFAVYEVRYINGAKVPITCSFMDGDEPRLIRYNDQYKFTPPE